MSEIVWIRQSTIFARCMDQAARVKPRWTQAWWRLVTELYLDKGGKVTEDEIDPDPEISDPDYRAAILD